MFRPRTSGPHEAATRVCKPWALCQNPGFGFRVLKTQNPFFWVRVFLHGLTNELMLVMNERMRLFQTRGP